MQCRVLEHLNEKTTKPKSRKTWDVSRNVTPGNQRNLAIPSVVPGLNLDTFWRFPRIQGTSSRASGTSELFNRPQAEKLKRITTGPSEPPGEPWEPLQTFKSCFRPDERTSWSAGGGARCRAGHIKEAPRATVCQVSGTMTGNDDTVSSK